MMPVLHLPFSRISWSVASVNKFPQTIFCQSSNSFLCSSVRHLRRVNLFSLQPSYVTTTLLPADNQEKETVKSNEEEPLKRLTRTLDFWSYVKIHGTETTPILKSATWIFQFRTWTTYLAFSNPTLYRLSSTFTF